MGIESGPKFTPGESEESPDSQKPSKSTGATDWSYIEERMAKKREKGLAAMSSEDREKALEEDKRTKERTEEIRQWAQGKQPKLEGPSSNDKDTTADQAQEQRAQEHKKNVQIIREQEYQKSKAGIDRFRKEHAIKKTAEEFEVEDRELRKKFGLE